MDHFRKLSKNGWIDDKDLEEYLGHIGCKVSDLGKALFKAGMYKESTNKKTGAKERHFRHQVSLNAKKKPHINYIKCFVTIKLAESYPNYCMESLTSHVFKIDPTDEAQLQRGSTLIRQVYDKVAPILNKTLDEQQIQSIADRARLELERRNTFGAFERKQMIVDSLRSLPSVSKPTKNKLKHRRSDISIAEVFMQDIILGMGMDEVHVRGMYDASNETEVLEARIQEMIKDLETRRSTFAQYVTIQNLFLLYTNMTNPTMFEECGVILIDENLCYRFLKECLDGNICLTGCEPPIADVLKSVETYEPTRAVDRFKEGSGSKFVTALSDLYSKQRMILGLPNVPRLRDFGLINTWLTNLHNGEAEKREMNYENRHGSIFPFDDPFAIVKAQSEYLLENDSWSSMRMRCLLLSQLWSISRWNEMAEWKLCDLMISFFTPEGDLSLKQPIIPVFLLQTKFKGSKRKKKLKPRTRLLVRRRDPSLCPQSALAMFLFERFVMDGEQEIDLLSENKDWYSIKIFRERLDRTKVPSSSTIRTERLKVNDLTGTSISGLANHYGRQMGSYIAKASGLSDREVKEVGMWSLDTHDAHYFNTFNPSLIARLSGYNSKETFHMPRALASTDAFSNLQPKHKSFFDNFLSFTTDEDTINEAIRMRGRGDNTPYMVLKTLRHLKEVFFQDLVYYKSRWPCLRLWNSLFFTQNSEALNSWLSYVQSFESVPNVPRFIGASSGVERHELMLLREEVQMLHRKLDTLLPSTANPSPQDETSPQRKATDEKININTLRVMNDMTIKDIVFEWFHEAITEGERFAGGLAKMKTNRKIAFNPRLRTQLRRRRIIAEKVVRLSSQLNSTDEAIAILEEYRHRETPTMRLWKLAEQISRKLVP